MIYLISGTGIGAGKTTLAHKLTPHVYSLADGIREELSAEYPQYKWYDRSQASKLTICQPTGKTLRQEMVERGQERCKQDPTYWPRRLYNTVDWGAMHGAVAIDDVRKIVEVQYFKEMFGSLCLHLHVQWPDAVVEPLYDDLSKVADYIVMRQA